MTNRNLILQCEHGLRMRVAASLAGVARDHRSTTVQVSCNDCQKANACSILELISLEAGRGARIEVSAEGPDEAVVLQAVQEILEDGAGI